YQSQLAERQARTHRAVAGAIETLHPDRVDERAALLAHHWEGAREPLMAARWHARAADWVAGRNRAEMARHWRRVHDLLATAPESQEACSLFVQACRFLVDSAAIGSGEDAPRLFAEGMARAERLDEPGPRIRLLNVYANGLMFAGCVEEAERHFRDSLRRADASCDAFLRFMVRVPLTRALNIGGRLHEAVAIGDEAVALGRDLPELARETGLSPYGLLLLQRGMALAYLGRPAQALEGMEEATALARERGDAALATFAHVCQVTPCDFLGDADGALAHARRAVELAEVGQNPWLRALAASGLGHASLLNGRYQD